VINDNQTHQLDISTSCGYNLKWWD
jgi:hypothetical protein